MTTLYLITNELVGIRDEIEDIANKKEQRLVPRNRRHAVALEYNEIKNTRPMNMGDASVICHGLVIKLRRILDELGEIDDNGDTP